MAPGISPLARRWSSPRMSRSRAPLACAASAWAGDGRRGSKALASINSSSAVLGVMICLSPLDHRRRHLGEIFVLFHAQARQAVAGFGRRRRRLGKGAKALGKLGEALR